MKRQINIQQVKQHDKFPPNPTKEEEIRSLPEKEYRIMIVKMIQNLENKMELQINRLETKIDKMQEMFNNDMSEWVKSLSHIWLFVTPWTVAHQAPLSMGFSRQEYWSELPFPK